MGKFSKLDRIEGCEQIHGVDLHQGLILQLCDHREAILLLCALGSKETQKRHPVFITQVAVWIKHHMDGNRHSREFCSGIFCMLGTILALYTRIGLIFIIIQGGNGGPEA